MPKMLAAKTRFYPNRVQSWTLEQMVGATRFLYNKAVEMINNRVAPFASVGEYREAMAKMESAHVAKEAKRREAHREQEAKRLETWREKWDAYQRDQAQQGSKKRKKEPAPFEPKEFQPEEFQPPRSPWLNKYWMRDYLASGTGPFHREHPWLNDVPKHTKEAAVYEAIEATKAALSNLRAGNITHFDLKFKSKKRTSWSLSLAPNAAAGARLFKIKFKEFGSLDLRERRGIKDKYVHEITLKKDDYGRYFMITREKHVPAGVSMGENQAQRRRDGQRVVMAIDPGQRTRHTVYSTDGSCYKIGDGDSKVLMSLCKRVDRLVSLLGRKHFLLNSADFRAFRRHGCLRQGLFRMDSLRNAARKTPGTHRVPMTHREIRVVRRRLRATRARIDNLKDEMDNQTVNFLCENADVVLIPDFDGHEVSRKLRSKTARALMNWRHGAFKTKLMERGTRRGVEVLVVSEHYTTKTCGRCGFIKDNVGASKVFCCDSCDVEIDRDFNGARNIFLRAIRRFIEAPEGVETVGR